MFEQVVEFYRTACVNTQNNTKIGKVSDKYKVEITPGDNTFLIWPVIYAQLLAYVLTSNVTQKQVDWFVKSMRLNSKWIHAFVKEDLTKSLEIIKENSKTEKTYRCILDSKTSIHDQSWLWY